MKKEKATAPAVAGETTNRNYSVNVCSNQIVDFTCLEIAKAKLDGGTKKSKKNVMFKCSQCGELKLGVNPEVDAEHGGVWKCLKCNVGGNRFELAAFINGLEYPKDSGPVHFWIRNLMEKEYGRVIEFKQPARVRLQPEKPKIISRVGGTLTQEPYLAVPPTLAAKFGEIKAGILQDVHFLCYYFKKEWISRSLSQWQDRLFWLNPDTVRKILKELTDAGLLLKKRTGRDLFWQVSYQELERAVSATDYLELQHTDEAYIQ